MKHIGINKYLCRLPFLPAFLLVTTSLIQCIKVDININDDHILQRVDDKFIGVTLDSSLIKDGWLNFNFTSRKLQNLAHGLSPCYLRIGGTSCDMLTFDPQKTTLNQPMTPYQEEQFLVTPEVKNFTMSRTDWDLINKFSSSVGWEILFDLNVLIRKSGAWDPTNAVVLLNYTAFRGYKIAGFELGNEPNSFKHVFGRPVPANQLSQDFIHLHKILHKSKFFQSALIIGPDTTQMRNKGAALYFEKFFASEKSKIINRATFHQYYVNGRTATIDDFMDPSILDDLKTNLRIATEIIQRRSNHTPLWLGETASAYGGGARGLSDAFVAGFMWLDKLGLCAQYGIKGVLRQSFYKGNYALLHKKTLEPFPDYWLTLLYKKLVGSNVFNLNASISTNFLRMYVHCTNSKRGYPPGSITLYGLNLMKRNVTLTLPQFPNQLLHTFWLTKGKEKGLRSRHVRLNGKTLKLENESIPPLLPAKGTTYKINLPAESFGFLVLPHANVALCKN